MGKLIVHNKPTAPPPPPSQLTKTGVEGPPDYASATRSTVSTTVVTESGASAETVVTKTVVTKDTDKKRGHEADSDGWQRVDNESESEDTGDRPDFKKPNTSKKLLASHVYCFINDGVMFSTRFVNRVLLYRVSAIKLHTLNVNKI